MSQTKTKTAMISDLGDIMSAANYPVVDVASSGTCDIGGASSQRVRITGTTTITSLGTVAERLRFVTFQGALTLTHNATTLILPGGANITTAAGDAMIATSDTSGNWTVLAYTTKADAMAASATARGPVELATDAEAQTGTDTARAITPANLTAASVKQGRHTIWIPAGGMIPRTTNGADPNDLELTTNDVMLASLDFDTTTEEGAGFWVWFPKSWDRSTVTFQPVWTAASGSGGVVFGLAAYAFSNDDALDTAVSGQQTSTDTLIAANDCHIGPESAAITIGGTPAENDLVYFEITREVGNGSDTLGVDAKLIGLKLFYTINLATDA